MEMSRAQGNGAGVKKQRWPERPLEKGRVLIVEDEKALRDSLGQLLGANGFYVSYASDGCEALDLLRSESLPSLIVLDLKMPKMDGWEFRSIQKDDPELGIIPVLAVSADRSAKASAISAQGYLRKPFDSNEVMTAVERVLAEDAARTSARLSENERLASLGRLAARLGHEINNPLAVVMLYVSQSLAELRSAIHHLELAPIAPSAGEAHAIMAGLENVAAMLEECEVGAERIRGTVVDLQRLSQKRVAERDPVDIQRLLDESVSIASSQIGHRAHLTRSYGPAATVRGDRAALREVFLTLLVNAAQSIPEGNVEGNEILVMTWLEGGAAHGTVVIEIRDSGPGIAPELISKVFEPYFTTKPLGVGMGLGLSISRETISDHGGLLTVESMLGQGTVFRILLPTVSSPGPSLLRAGPATTSALLAD